MQFRLPFALPHFAMQTVTAIVLLAASIVEFSTAADLCSHTDVSCSNNKIAWAIAAGVITTFFALVILSFAYFRLGVDQVGSVYLYADLAMSFILVIIWAVAAAINTKSDGIFVNPGNGYFSTWVCLFASVYLAHITMGLMGPNFAHHVNWNSPILILLASLVVMSVAADYLHNGINTSRTKWAVACGTISTFFCLCQLALLYMRLPIADDLSPPLSLFLVALWAAGAGVNTSSDGPFYYTGNGYYFSWIAFAAAIHYAYCVFFRGPATGLPFSGGAGSAATGSAGYGTTTAAGAPLSGVQIGAPMQPAGPMQSGAGYGQSGAGYGQSSPYVTSPPAEATKAPSRPSSMLSSSQPLLPAQSTAPSSLPMSQTPAEPVPSVASTQNIPVHEGTPTSEQRRVGDASIATSI
jgi:hypothetical protein